VLPPSALFSVDSFPLVAIEPSTLRRWGNGFTTVPFGDSPSSYAVLSDFAAVVTYTRKTFHSNGHRVRVFTATYVTVKNDFFKVKKIGGNVKNIS
jgi:hypothetical protein